MIKRERIIVIGAGPVGLTAALRLGESGISTLVLEQAPALNTELRASTFHPPTLDMLDEYGLGQALVKCGLITPSWQIRLHETGEKAEFDLAVLKDHTAHPYRLQCEQTVLCRLLLERLNKLDSVELRFNTGVTKVGQSADAVFAVLQDSGETLEGRYLIGCDGAHSVVRNAMDVAFIGHTYPETTILVTTPFEFREHLPGLSGVNYIWKRGGTFSLLRLPDIWRCSFHPRTGESTQQALRDTAIQAHLDEVVPGRGPFNIGEKRPYRVHQRIAESYSRGRLFLAGDAAHLNSPKGGMGMNGGIHDAFNLTDKLRRVYAGADEKILERYNRQRRPIALDEIIKQADANRARMNETDPQTRRLMLKELQTITHDPAKRLAFLLRSSMISGLRRAHDIR